MVSVNSFDGLIWVIGTLTGLIVLQKTLHREIQAVILLLSQRPGLTQILFAVILFPGVLLHETSHYLSAKLLGVKTGRFSIIPRTQEDGKLRLGYVEIASAGFVREALIGLAPLVTGIILVAYIAIFQMTLLPTWEYIRLANFSSMWAHLMTLPQSNDFWLWFYVAFSISSTMMPSASDRHAWLPLGLLLFGLLGLAILAGAGSWMLDTLAPPLNQFLQACAMIFGFSALLHLLLIIPFWVMHKIIAKVTRMDLD